MQNAFEFNSTFTWWTLGHDYLNRKIIACQKSAHIIRLVCFFIYFFYIFFFNLFFVFIYDSSEGAPCTQLKACRFPPRDNNAQNSFNTSTFITTLIWQILSSYLLHSYRSITLFLSSNLWYHFLCITLCSTNRNLSYVHNLIKSLFYEFFFFFFTYLK